MGYMTIEAVKDFQLCERLFDYRYREKLSEKIYSRETHAKKFEDTLKSIFFFFFFKKQAGIIPSYASLLNRWEKLWYPKDTTSYEIITEQHETVYGNISNLTSKAAAILLLFHEMYSKSDYIPIAIEEEFIIPRVSKNNIKDNFDFIFYKNKKFYITKILFNYRKSNRDIYKMDFSGMYKGFNHKNPDKIHNAKFGYIDVMSQDLSFTEFHIRKFDIDHFDYWCDRIDSTEVFVPRRGLITFCKKCPFDKPCSKWSEWKKEIPPNA
jgi:hypothetical protein